MTRHYSFRIPANLLAILLAVQGAAVPLVHQASCPAGLHHHHAHEAPDDGAAHIGHHHSDGQSVEYSCLICQFLAQRALSGSVDSCELSFPLRSSLHLDQVDSAQSPLRLSRYARGPPVLG